MRTGLLTATVLLIAIVSPLSAAKAFELDPEMVERLSKSVHKNMAGGMVGDGHIITKEEAAQLKYPLIPFELRRQIIVIGTLSGFAELCGLDWQNKNFLPMMKGIRNKHTDWNDYQFAFAGMLHGVSQSMAVNSGDSKSTCTDPFKANIEKNMLVR